MAELKNKTLRTRIAQKYAKVDEWRTSTLQLLQGELAFDETGRYKIGQAKKDIGGIVRHPYWNELPYSSSYAFLPDNTIHENESFPRFFISTNGLPNISTNDYQSGTIVIVPSGTVIQQEDATDVSVTTTEDKIFVVVETESVVNNATTYNKAWKEINSTNQEVVTELINNLVEQKIEETVGDLSNTGITVDGVDNPTIADYLSTLQDEIDAQALAQENNISELVTAIADNTHEIDALKTVVDNDSTDAPGLVQKVAEINGKIGDTSNSEYQGLIGETIVSKLVGVSKNATIAKNAVDNIWDADKQEIKTSVLPAFVDDVIEGFVAPVSLTELYGLTHLPSATPETPDTVLCFFTLVDDSVAKSLRTEQKTTKYAIITDDESYKIKKSVNSGINVTSLPASITYNDETYPIWNSDAKYKLSPETDAIYVDILTNNTYRWGGSQFVLIASSLAIGTTAGTAFEGDRGASLESAVTTLISEVNTLETNVNTELADANARIEANTIAIASLRSDINSDNTEITDRLSEIENTLGDIEQTNISGTTVAGQLTQLNTGLQNVILQSNNNKNDIDALESSMTDLTARVSANEADITTLNAAIVSLQSKDVDLEGSINALAASMESSVADVSAIETSISSIESEISAIDGKIGELPAGVDSIQDEIDEIKEALEQQSSDLEPRVAELEETTNAHSVAITDLINQHEKDVDELVSVVTSIKQTIDIESVIENTPTKTVGNDSNVLDLGEIDLILDCGGASENG